MRSVIMATYLSGARGFCGMGANAASKIRCRTLLPGDPERKKKADRLENGIPVDMASWKQIVTAASRIGLDEISINRIAKL